jgi:hypothetical protein
MLNRPQAINGSVIDQIKAQPVGKRISPSIIDDIFGGAEKGMMGAADDL